MSSISRTYTFTDGTTAYGSQVENEISTVFTAFNNHDAGTSVWTVVKTSLLKVADGSASAPTMSFSDEATSGWYRFGANQVALSIAGTNAYNFLSTQFSPNPDATINFGSASAQWAVGYFATRILISATSNQLQLGATRTVTITAPTPASASRTWTIPDISGDGTFAALSGTQTFSGAKTFSGGATFSGNLTVSQASPSTPTANTIYKDNIIKAWANFTTITDTTLNDGFNITSLTDNGTGDTTLTWETDFADINYVVTGMAFNEGAGNKLYMTLNAAPLVGSCRVIVVNEGGNASDSTYNMVMAIGNQ